MFSQGDGQILSPKSLDTYRAIYLRHFIKHYVEKTCTIAQVNSAEGHGVGGCPGLGWLFSSTSSSSLLPMIVLDVMCALFGCILNAFILIYDTE